MTDSPQTILHGAPRAELARLCRHICLAREQGAMPPLTAEDEFLLALAAVRATYGPDSANEDDLHEIVGIEESRVADAAVVAELVASRLAMVSAAPRAAAREDARNVPESGGSNPPFNVIDLIGSLVAQERRDVRSGKTAGARRPQPLS